MSDVSIQFAEKAEKVNSWRFDEVVGPTDEPKIGSLYVRKGYLKEIDWRPGQRLSLIVGVPAGDLEDDQKNEEWKRTGEGTVVAED